MKLVGSRKLTWGICSIGVLLAIVSVFFLPQIIPIHFANGIADDFGNIKRFFISYFVNHNYTFDWKRKHLNIS